MIEQKYDRQQYVVSRLTIHQYVLCVLCVFHCPLQYLADNWGCWTSFAGVGDRGKGACLYRGPYPLQPIAPRPIMLDSAGGEVDYPDISHRLAKKQKRNTQAQGGTFARLFGGWGT
jgi:hypothetical protein